MYSSVINGVVCPKWKCIYISIVYIQSLKWIISFHTCYRILNFTFTPLNFLTKNDSVAPNSYINELDISNWGSNCS